MHSIISNLDKLSVQYGQVILFPNFESNNFIPLFLSKVPAGFPSPADDYLESKIDLNELVTKNSPATFIVKVKGTSMLEAGIMDGDYLVVDRSLEPKDGKIIVVSIDGHVTVKQLKVRNGVSFLLAANNKFPRPVIEINENSNVEIFGVVVSVTHLY